MELKEYLKKREEWLNGEIDDHEFIPLHEVFVEEWEYDVEDENIEEVLKSLFGRVMKDITCSCGDSESIHYYSPRWDLCIHICINDPNNPLIKLHY